MMGEDDDDARAKNFPEQFPDDTEEGGFARAALSFTSSREPAVAEDRRERKEEGLSKREKETRRTQS